PWPSEVLTPGRNIDRSHRVPRDRRHRLQARGPPQVSVGLACPDGQDSWSGGAAFGEAIEGKASIGEGVEEGGERIVGGADLVANALVGIGGLRPMAGWVAGPDDDCLWVGAV